MKVFGAVLLIALLFVGEVKCIVKAFSCNYKPIGKAEIFYVAGSLTGLGCVIGWLDIKDN